MSEIEVSTHLGTGQKLPFVRIEDATEMVKQASTSRPGAIVITIDGVEFIGPDLFDEIDTFWPLFIDGVDELRRTGSGTSYWADQAIQVDYSSFEASSNETYVHMRLVIRREPVEGREAYTSLTAFSQAVGDAAMLFYEKANLLDPERFPRDSHYEGKIARWRTEDGLNDTGG